MMTLIEIVLGLGYTLVVTWFICICKSGARYDEYTDQLASAAASMPIGHQKAEDDDAVKSFALPGETSK